MTSHTEGAQRVGFSAPLGETSAQKERRERLEAELLVGYQFDDTYMKQGKTPLDFMRDKNTSKTQIWGIQIHDLRRGIQGATIPPLPIWKSGKWIEEVDEALPYDFSDELDNSEFFHCWITDGQGTPGMYEWRFYLIPHVYALTLKPPPHPIMWKPKEKKGKSPAGRFLSTRTMKRKPGYSTLSPPKDSDWQWGSDSSSAPAPVAAKAPPLPVGVRFQCQCGHWHKESDLAAHMKVCPAIHGEDGKNGWALTCDDKCGCEFIAGFPTEAHAVGHKTLDHVSRCKPGFVPTKKEEVVASMDPTEEKDEVETPEEMKTVSEATDQTETPETAETGAKEEA